jgi:hypothetical protein
VGLIHPCGKSLRFAGMVSSRSRFVIWGLLNFLFHFLFLYMHRENLPYSSTKPKNREFNNVNKIAAQHGEASYGLAFGVMLASHLLQSTLIELLVYSLANKPGDPFTGWHVSRGVP